MSEAITGLIVAVLAYAAQALRQKMKERKTNEGDATTNPPPQLKFCKQCFFFREYRKATKHLTDSNSDTQIIRIHRDHEGIDK